MTAEAAEPVAPSAPLRRTEYRTCDAEEAREFIAQSFAGAGLRVAAVPDADWEVSVTSAAAEHFSTTRIRVPGDLDFAVESEGQTFVATLLDGSTSLERGPDTTRYTPGDVLLSNCPEASWSCHTHQSYSAVVSFDDALLAEVADPAGSDEPDAWRPMAYEPMPGGTVRWRQALRYVDGVLADPVAAASPIMVGQAGRLLAATATTVFPSAADPSSGSEPSRDGHPVTLRRALAYLETNLDADIGVADLARAANVSPRAVQLAFRRHLGTTPSAHLRRVRLDRAHAELTDADPSSTNVTEVAARWGFTPSRFSRVYRQTYARRPSETLRG